MLLIGTLATMGNVQRHKDGVIKWDIVWYYSYLPAYFIHHDIKLGFVDLNNKQLVENYNPQVLPNNTKVIKTTMGLAYCYAPAFALAYAYECWQYGSPGNGFGPPYQLAMYLIGVLYAFIGLWYLRKWLLFQYPDKVVSWTLLAVYLGTNMLYYTFHEGNMSHIYNFCFASVLLYITQTWHTKPTLYKAILLGIMGGMLTLIRPINILMALVFLLYNVVDRRNATQKLNMLWQYKHHLLAAVVAAFLIGFPQLLYWKHVTGQWLFYSYTNERFFFTHPRLIEGFFSYRKGWLLYTPIMALALAGFVALYRQNKPYFGAISLFFCSYTYIVFSWWCWWYGGGFGIRAMIDAYPFLALPMAAMFAYLFKQTSLVKYSSTSLIICLVLFNMFQTHQYRKGILHWDSMTKQAYWAVFLKTQKPGNFDQLIETPNNEKALKGEDSYGGW